MAKKYTDRNYQHSLPKSRLQQMVNVFKTKEGAILVLLSIGMSCLYWAPYYYQSKDVGRKEFMRREDRKVAAAILAGEADDSTTS